MCNYTDGTTHYGQRTVGVGDLPFHSELEFIPKILKTSLFLSIWQYIRLAEM
jgi:hypothetical protein